MRNDSGWRAEEAEEAGEDDASEKNASEKERKKEKEVADEDRKQ